MTIPGIIWAETLGYMKHGFIGAVALMGIAMMGFAAGYHDIITLVAALFVFFVGLNLLEALLPSLVSRTAPPSRKGRALGVYNTAQSIGLFAGGAVGGIAADLGGNIAVFLTCAALGLILLIVSAFVQPPAKHSIG